ncbi:hypothetical protein RvY_12860 [Ramazzottius varieornatus]|uniref:SAC domain-containing protein n=1 Tax=Ramazzottius varieornatus TaxID=947166 RepID=A0A1D1VKY4_RAMVA|nr:hypothetical protein RvY_12860 [Ramazzottius varieornatus]
MQLFKSRSHFLFVEGQHCLFCSRFDGSLEAKPCTAIDDLRNHEFVCHLDGIVGKVQVFPESEPKLILILHKSTVAEIGQHEIFRVDKVGILALSPMDPREDDRLLFKGKTDAEAYDSESINDSGILSEANLVLMNRGVQKTFKTLRQATNFNLGGKINRKNVSDREKLERRILEDIIKMFNGSQSFYYSLTMDLTNSMQRQYELRVKTSSAADSQKRPSWHSADERFFWNRNLWKDFSLLDAEESHWIVPVIQGYVQQELIALDLDKSHAGSEDFVVPTTCQILLISRRSRDRAGTRYKRRGVDDKGKVANYVETEQIISILEHHLSFVQVRGSIPVFWSQPGMRYRPAPRIDRSLSDSHTALARHFVEQFKLYGRQVAINLVEQYGREKVLADAYLESILDFDSENLVYVSFDFHAYCRGMHLENIEILIESLQEVFQSMRFFWSKHSLPATEQDVMCLQRSVFRVNCVDCLDRTNVIQAALGRVALESQLRKMGLLLPEQGFPLECRQALQIMWANNGDAISRQYAGTSALKGDVTRTGERKFAGLMKDGYTSANRYYLNQFRDAYRQAAIDASLGKHFEEESILVPGVTAPALDASELERVKQLVEDSKRIIISDSEVVLGGWPMIDADANADPSRTDMDTVLLLSTEAYYVGEYSVESDQLVGYQRVLLDEVDSIETGMEPKLLGAKKMIIRINYHIDLESGYCHQFRTAGVRFFNSIVMPIATEEENLEMLRSIAESFSMAIISKCGSTVPVLYGKLQKKVTKIPPKAAAPLESQGGIFTAVAPSVASGHSAVGGSAGAHRSQIGGVLSAVKNRLVDLNPIRLPGFSRQTPARHRTVPDDTVHFDNQAGLPSIAIESSDSSFEHFEHVEQNSGQLVASVNSAPNLIEFDSETNQALGSFNKRYSSSSAALDVSNEPEVLHSPLVLSASPSIGGFQIGDMQTRNGQQLSKPSVNQAARSPAGEHSKSYQHSKSKRTCKTKMIEL